MLKTRIGKPRPFPSRRPDGTRGSFGMERNAAKCSTGSWVGPSSPTPMLSCVRTYITPLVHQSAQADRCLHIVPRRPKNVRTIRANAPVQAQAVGNARHRKFPYAEMDVAPLIAIRREERFRLPARFFVEGGKVRTASEQAWHHVFQLVEHDRGCVCASPPAFAAFIRAFASTVFRQAFFECVLIVPVLLGICFFDILPSALPIACAFRRPLSYILCRCHRPPAAPQRLPPTAKKDFS